MARRKSKEFELKELAPNRIDADAMNQLRESFRWTVQRRDVSVFRRQRINFDARNCVWPNQYDDGRKWHAKAFPWKGAADSKVPLMDLYCNLDVAFLMVLWRRSRTIVTGTESNDAEYANRLTQVLRWMKFTQMKEAPREMRLLANYFFERGSAVLQTVWDRRQQLGYDELDLETIKGLAMDVVASAEQNAGALTDEDERIALLPQFIIDPSREEDAAQSLQVLYKDVRIERLRKAVQDLRNTGIARFPRPYLVRDRPAITALAPNEDLFIDPEATCLQEASGIYRREFLTETALRERQFSHGWDKKWIAAMLATQRGNITTDFDGQLFRRNQGKWNSQVTNPDRLFEVVHGWRRLGDEDGVPGIYCTVFNPNLSPDEELVAKHELCDYDHGEYPFVHYAREVRSRQLDDSRGYGEIGGTWQQTIKRNWDGESDRADVATLPPYYYPEGTAPDEWGPGVGVPTSRPDEYGFMETPKYDRGSGDVQDRVRMFADEYFGHSNIEGKEVDMSILKQDLANLWMTYNGAADTQQLQLMQQYMPDNFYFRIVGSAKGKPIHTTREEIQGQFDVSVSFNVDDMDPAKVSEKMALLEKALTLDTTGRIDRDEALTVVFEMLDPNMGERLLRDPQEASLSELEDEDLVFTKMRAGVGTDVKEQGQAWQLRLQRLETLLQQNPGAQSQLEQDESFRGMLENRVKQLKFQVFNHGMAQQAGRLGGMPANAQMQM